jgi:hypothetical protein
MEIDSFSLQLMTETESDILSFHQKIESDALSSYPSTEIEPDTLSFHMQTETDDLSFHLMTEEESDTPFLPPAYDDSNVLFPCT